MTRSCIISVNDERSVCDVQLELPNHAFFDVIPKEATFRLLSIVETARVPLHLVVGSPFAVHTSSADTENWFQDILLRRLPSPEDANSPSWWATARPESTLGILVAVPEHYIKGQPSTPRLTELLFFASQSNDADKGISISCSSPQAPGGSHCRTKFGVYAVALSSELCGRIDPTPPPSPIATDTELEARFLPHTFRDESQIINEPPVRKRRSATDVFDAASERRKKARRKDGEGVSATAATKADSQAGSMQHRRSNSATHLAPRDTTPLSRSPSVSSSRPPTAMPISSRPSTLSHVQSVTAVVDTPDLESKNKNFISRIVMTGMRLYGLSQSKTRRTRANSSAPSPVIDASFEDMDAERKNDEEFKLIYHQAFKGTCFAFRAVIAKQNLLTCSDAIRDTADKLLAIFCCDPIEGQTKLEMAQSRSTGMDAFA